MEGRSMQTTSKSEEAGWWTCYQGSSRMNMLQLLLCCYRPYLWEILEMFSFSSQMCSTSKFCWWKWRHCMLSAFLQIVSSVSTITIHFIFQHASQIKMARTSIWWRMMPQSLAHYSVTSSTHWTMQISVSCCRSRCKGVGSLTPDRCSENGINPWCLWLTTTVPSSDIPLLKRQKVCGLATQASWLYMFLWPGAQLEELCLLNWKKNIFSVFMLMNVGVCSFCRLTDV